MRKRTHNREETGPREAAAQAIAYKRVIYVACCAIGIVAVLFAWGFLVSSGGATRFDQIVLPGIGATLAVAIFWLRAGTALLPRVEWLLFAITGVPLSAKFADVMFVIHADGVHDLSPYHDLFPWLPLLAILASLVFVLRRWLLAVTAFYASIAVFGLVHVLPGLASGATTSEGYLLFRALLANVACILLLAVGVRLHARFAVMTSLAESMQRLALTDELTSLPNRRSVASTLGAEIARAQRYGGEFSVGILDIDHFKGVNDRFGHEGGDRVLRAVAQATAAGLRTSDLVGRWGGEEFLIVATQTGAAGAIKLADRLRVRIEALCPEGVGRVTASFGVATFQRGDTAEAVLGRADLALYRAKAEGRNRVCAADPAAAEASVEAVSGAAPGGLTAHP